MKRLLLVPALVIALVACREKHVTGNSPAPDKPDANNYPSGVTHTQTPSNADVQSSDQNTDADVNTNGSSTNTITGNDTVITNVSMPDNGGGNTSQTQTAIDSTKLKRLVVSFISKGDGTDHATHEKLDQWLAKHQDVKYEMVSWGREGEFDYVFDLTDRTAAGQRSVVSEITSVVGSNNDRVLVQEWVQPHVARNTGIVPPDYTPPQDTSNTARLVVSFISKGEGIDHDTQKAFEDWLQQNYSTATWEVTHWGREGEVNYCFRCANMDARHQEIFVRDVRTFLTGKELVLVSEYAPCDKRK